MLTEKELERKRQNLHFAIQCRKYLPLIFLYSCFLFVMIPTAFCGTVNKISTVGEVVICPNCGEKLRLWLVIGEPLKMDLNLKIEGKTLYREKDGNWIEA